MEILRQIGESAESLQGTGATWAVATIITGAISCFLGYKLLRFWIVLGGLVIGGVGGFYITASYSKNLLVQVIVAVLAAIILAMISYNLYLVGVFLLCGLLGLVLSSYLIQPQTEVLTLICVVIGVAAGALAVRFVRPMVILSTSLQGGLSMATGIVALAGLENNVFLGGIALAIGAFGCFVQFMMSARKKDRNAKDD